MISEALFLWVVGGLLAACVLLVGVVWSMLTQRIEKSHNELSSKLDEQKREHRISHSDAVKALWKQIDKHRDTKADKAEVSDIKSDLRGMREHMLLMSNAMAEVSQNMSHIADEITLLRQGR